MSRGDWTVHHQQTWDSPTSGLIRPASEGVIPDNGVPIIRPLTAWHSTQTSALDPYARAMMPEAAMYHRPRQVRGFIHFVIEPQDPATWGNVFGVSWWMDVRWRILPMRQVPSGTGVAAPSTYDLYNTPSADEPYLWHEERQFLNLATNEWTGLPGARTTLRGTVRVLVRMREWLEKPWILVLCSEARMHSTTYWDANVPVQVRQSVFLRTFVEVADT